MALVKCADCGREVSDAAAACVNCGRPTVAGGAPSPVRAQLSRGTFALLLIVLALVVGKVRFVSGTDRLVLPRQNFGYSDMFATIDDCTAGPWIAVMSTHGSLCRDLQVQGIIESEDMRTERLARETSERLAAYRRATETPEEARARSQRAMQTIIEFGRKARAEKASEAPPRAALDSLATRPLPKLALP